jgi:Icc-related predicted phosphoesterase
VQRPLWIVGKLSLALLSVNKLCVIIRGMIRFSAVGDVHCSETAAGHLAPLFQKVNSDADFLLLVGDLTTVGRPREAEVLCSEMKDINVPIIAVLGNHDCEENREAEIVQVLRQHDVTVLDGDSVVLDVRGQRVGIAGAKGFCGGFDKYAVEAFGEQALKEFVYVSVREALKIEEALSTLDSDYRIVMVHYAPIRDTVVGEAIELWPFLGSSALAKPIDSLGANVVVHAHAHYGSPSGSTKTGIPVFNVARTVQKGLFFYELP